MKIIKDTGIKESTDSRKYHYAIFECDYCHSHTEKILKDGKKAKYCSHKCYAANRIKRGAYKRKIISKKYYYIYIPEHPYAIGTRKLYIAEHRLIMEKHIDRYLVKNEIVHHINEDTLDNRIENLQLMSASNHIKLHKLNAKRQKNGQFKI